MVDKFGIWTEESDYISYPREKWCDMDHVACWIRGRGYSPNIHMAELVVRIIDHFTDESGDNADYRPTYGDDLMIHIPNLAAFVEDSGGISEFDY